MTLTPEERREVVAYRVERSFAALNEAKYVAKGCFWNLAANRLYYSAFYACHALLMNNMISANSHSGVARMISLHFVIEGVLSESDGKLLKKLFRMRQTGDYDDLTDWSEEDILPVMEATEALIKKIVSIINV